MAQRHSVITDDDEDFDPDFEDVDVYEDEDDEDLEDYDEDDGETEESGQSQPGVDWEQRFKGLQSSLQQSQEAAAAARQEAFMARAEAVRTQIAAAGLEPQEADRQFKMWLIGQANEMQAHQNMSDRQALEQVSRSAYLQRLVNEYGIDTSSKTFQRLVNIKDPEDMRVFAEEASEREKRASKQTKKAVRRAKGADKFDSGGGRVGSPPKKKAKNLDDAAAAFSRYKIEF